MGKGQFTILPTVLTILLWIAANSSAQTVPLDSIKGLKLKNVAAEPVTYSGRKAVRLIEPSDSMAKSDGDRLALVTGLEFQDGVIEVDLTGKPAAGTGPSARGFVGMAFRVAPDMSKFECFYIRPTNGRADDQERRNHSVQYISYPDFPWQRLRKETPEKYESYVDLVPGEWTKLKIEVHGTKARLYLHGNPQPTLLVNDLKLGEAKGGVALWLGPGTDANFSNLRVSK